MIWRTAKEPPATRISTRVRLANGVILVAEYKPVNHVWRARDGRVVWPVVWMDDSGEPEPRVEVAAQDADAEKENDDWLICSVDRFVDHWLAGWESGAIARPACTR